MKIQKYVWLKDEATIIKKVCLKNLLKVAYNYSFNIKMLNLECFSDQYKLIQNLFNVSKKQFVF